ncbi:MAG TPA: NAD-dependent epimerase/dehydratase family protein [Acidimicrobiales bacterium]
MPRALVLGGTGVVGRAVAQRLLESGWSVDITGRDPRKFDPAVQDRGASYRLSDRSDASQLRNMVGAGADLVVDCVCYSAADAELLVPLAKDVASLVMISSKAVYVDRFGRHSNSVESPHFDGPILETSPTVPRATTPSKAATGTRATKSPRNAFYSRAECPSRSCGRRKFTASEPLDPESGTS